VHTLHYRAYYITVENNHFYRGTNAVFQKRGFWAGTPLKGIRCRFNLIERVSAGVHIAGVRNEGPDERDRNHYYCNVFLDCSAEIVRVSTDNFTHLCHDDIQVYNNVIANNPGSAYGAVDIQPIAHGSLYNNEFSPADRNNKWFNNITVGTFGLYGHLGYGSHGGDTVDVAWWQAFFKSSRNLYQSISAMWRGTTEPLLSATWEDLQAGGGEAGSLRNVNPLLDGDWKPQPGSPAIGLGRDLLGTFGPVDGVIDAGCYPTGTEVIGIRNG
jgi:hypothetical protein